MTRTKVTNSSLAFDSGPFSSRNKIINPAMEISQRGTSFSSNGYTLDRFIQSNLGGAVSTTTQSTDVPNNTFQNSLKVDITTADTSIASTDYSVIIQIIEGYNVRDLIGQTFTLSFWVKSPKTGIHCVGFRNNTYDRSYVVEYTVSIANTWEFKTVTVVGGLITAGTWNWTNGRGLDVCFTLAVGSAYYTTPNSWQVGNFIATSNQVNCVDSTSNDFFLTGVQLELGQEPTPFERRPYGAELVLCQRYYQQLGNIVYATIGSGLQRSTTEAGINVPLLQSLRTSSPNISFSSLMVTDRASADAAVSSINDIRVSQTSLYLSLVHTSFGAVGRGCLLAPNTNGFLRVDAEL